MKHIIITSLLAILVALGGCVSLYPDAGMLPGKISSLQDGTEMNFGIQINNTGQLYRTGGAITASNLATGERFSGQYAAFSTGGRTSQSNITNSWGISTGAINTTSESTGSTARGILKGDKGTIITISLDCQSVFFRRNVWTPGGSRPTGFGEGTDNKGGRYQIQF